MLAIIAAFLIALHAFGVRAGTFNLFELGLAFWALHFGVSWGVVTVPWPRRSE